MKQLLFFVYSSLITVCALSCSETPVAGNGGSSETINAKIIITDTMVSVTDDKADETVLTLEAFSIDYRPYENTGYIARLDSDVKKQVLKLPAAGYYNFLVTCREQNLTGFISNVEVLHDAKNRVTCTLTSGTKVAGWLKTQGTHSLNEQYAVSIYGSPFVCVTDNKQSFSMGLLPDGNYTMSIRPVGKRFLISSARYNFSTIDNSRQTILEVTIP
ncbi:MAG TPA: hypothetical protein VHO70_15235 [Chitinispirillaceae bacterium]|nr:hypothetical protein [Chitinispirillaceae bacterium]